MYDLPDVVNHATIWDTKEPLSVTRRELSWPTYLWRDYGQLSEFCVYVLCFNNLLYLNKVIVISNMRAPILIYTSWFWDWVGREISVSQTNAMSRYGSIWSSDSPSLTEDCKGNATDVRLQKYTITISSIKGNAGMSHSWWRRSNASRSTNGCAFLGCPDTGSTEFP